ncbi:MAG: glycerate kinase [Bacilli bacterium]|jgi:glycerate kinase|nr:glycerate kinase [Bacilli bacterium]
MKIILAPDSFKGSLTSDEFIKIASDVIKEKLPAAEIVPFWMADGGEGSLQALSHELPLKFYSLKVKNPLGRRSNASFAMDKENAYVEMASASGLLKMRKNKPQGFISTSYGTGELIKAALDRGAKTIYLCLGGSGTVDGGSGAMKALGAYFKDSAGHQVLGSAKNLSRIATIDLNNFDSRIKDVHFISLADVINPLCGDNGAVKVFGPQKGLSPEQLEIVEKGMEHYAEVLKKTFHVDLQSLVSGGAAGGMGTALSLFCSAEVTSGADMILKLGHFEEKCQNADYIFTGEGKLDASSFQGKAISRLVEFGQKHHVRTVAFVGTVENITPEENGLYRIIALKRPEMTTDYSIKHAKTLLEKAIEKFILEVKKD